MAAERQKTIREFDTNAPLTPKERDVINILKGPTRYVADLYNIDNPYLWYGQVRPEGDYSSDTFRREYLKRAELNPRIRNPYSLLDKDWIPQKITTISGIEGILEDISYGIMEAARYIKKNYGADDESAMKFSRYLKRSVDLLNEGDFDGLMKLYVEQDQSFPVGWGLVFAETYNDPMKDRPVPQANLTLCDAEATNEAMSMINRLRKVANVKKTKYGRNIEPRPAQVVVANVLLLSGRLAEINDDYSGFREPSGFNLPNDTTLTDKSLIYIFKGRIEEKNVSLSRKLESLVGIPSDPKDLMTHVVSHEYGHGYHEPNDLENFGVLNQVARELMANDLGSVLMRADLFTPLEKRRYCTGLLAYAVDDVGKYSTILSDPSAIRDTSLDQLMCEIGDYGLAALATLKSASGEAIRIRNDKPAQIKYDLLFKQARERFLELSEIARNGNPDKTRDFFQKQIYGLNLYSAVKLNKIAS